MTSVLVVEDDHLLANVVDLALSEHGYSVGVARSVGEAFVALRAQPVDVLLTDLQPGRPDGMDLLRALSQLSPRTRGVLMSGFATARDYQRAVESGAVRVLCKPFTSQDLIRCVRHAVECDTGFHGSIHGLSLIDVLQMFNVLRRSISIAVAGPRPGLLHLRDGEIIHAEHGRRTGESALRSLLALRSGAFSTSVLPDLARQSISRDFRELLLDLLREIDEAAGDGTVRDPMLLEVSQAIVYDAGATDAGDGGRPGGEGEAPAGLARSARQILEAVRGLDGYLAARLVLSRDGRVIEGDGAFDLWQSAKLTSQVARQSWEAAGAGTGADNSIEEIVISAVDQYHLLHRLDARTPAFVHLVLERQAANLGMARLALAAAVKAAVKALDR